MPGECIYLILLLKEEFANWKRTKTSIYSELKHVDGFTEVSEVIHVIELKQSALTHLPTRVGGGKSIAKLISSLFLFTSALNQVRSAKFTPIDTIQIFHQEICFVE